LRDAVTVGIPVRNGASTIGGVLAAVRSQRGAGSLDLVVVDSGSTDRSRLIAKQYGARLIDIPPEHFSHGGTRDLIFQQSEAPYVALLTQDAEPANDRWLASLVAGFNIASDVGLVLGPYIPRREASAAVRRELSDFFEAMAPGGRPRLDRLAPGEGLPTHPGPLTFVSSANACISRSAWEHVRFRPAPYAEDQLFARDLLAAGFAKVFEPRAAVIHSHEYGPWCLFQRFFDEWRGLREVYGWVEPVGLRATPKRVLREVAADRAFARLNAARRGALVRETLRSFEYHALRAAGSALGSRAERLPSRLRTWCSLEGRGTFEPASPPAIAA
jgi:glycosyltransferase involved in cell wall biosynthesis